jgi:hypothetical protein
MDQSQDSAKQTLAAMMFTCAGIEIYAEFKNGYFPPRPIRFVGVAAVFMILTLVSSASPILATVMGAGLLIALIIHLPGLTSGAAAAGQALNQAGAAAAAGGNAIAGGS